MKHLISATLSMEAGQVWESWPVHSETEVGRSATLSMLMVDSGELVLRQKANMLMIGSLRGNIATHRRRILDFIFSVVWEMNEDLDGSIHYEPDEGQTVDR